MVEHIHKKLVEQRHTRLVVLAEVDNTGTGKLVSVEQEVLGNGERLWQVEMMDSSKLVGSEVWVVAVGNRLAGFYHFVGNNTEVGCSCREPAWVAEVGYNTLVAAGCRLGRFA